MTPPMGSADLGSVFAEAPVVSKQDLLIYLYFAYSRARRWHAQMSHVFAVCDEVEDKPRADEVILSFRSCSTGSFHLAFMSPWEIAKAFAHIEGETTVNVRVGTVLEEITHGDRVRFKLRPTGVSSF
jgi:hypothetical protein